MIVDTSLEFAKSLDQQDELAHFRQKFCIPKTADGDDVIYLCGNSLGLMPRQTPDYIHQELEDWKNWGVEGHFHAQRPWMPYHEFLSEQMADIVGARPSEVVVMNSLTVNLHLMMVSFYKPNSKRYKILFDYSPFPSDRYAIASQIRFHGYNPSEAMIELQPQKDSEIVSEDYIADILEKHGDEIALILIGGVNYYTGQLYDIARITAMGHRYGCMVGFDLAHAAGNVTLNLHDDGPDFAAWCTYKYLNSGPGSLSGCFVHERHHHSDLPRFEGWWGNDKKTRFLMQDEFLPIPGAEAWQLSNPPILSMAAVKSSLDVFSQATMKSLRSKSEKLTLYLEELILHTAYKGLKIITPHEPHRRGCQLSLQMEQSDKSLFMKITEAGVIADWREPDVIRIAPVPLYNSFEDVWKFHHWLQQGLSQ